MTQAMRRILAALAASVVVPLLAAGQAAAEPPIWVVSDGDSEMVLFGSIHVLPPELDWRPPELTAALSQADDLWFELPIDPSAEQEAAQAAAMRGYLPPDQSLSSMLSEDGRTRLARISARFGLSPTIIERLQPWFAEVALSAGAFKASGAGIESGVERTVSGAAPAGVRRMAFETPAEQIAMFAAAPRAEQVASLEETLREIEEDPDAYEVMVRAWMSGDLAALDDEALKPLRESAPALYERLVTRRNAAWTRTLDARLKGSGRTVVVVGVGHLLGPGGVPARLRALGYSVKGP